MHDRQPASSETEGPIFNQFGIYSWFKGVEPNPPGYEGFLFLHFLGLERCWAWQIPMRNAERTRPWWIEGA
jgi:hypothetical protein